MMKRNEHDPVTIHKDLTGLGINFDKYFLTYDIL